MSLFDLSGIVAVLGNDSITVEAPTAGTYDANGVAPARSFGMAATDPRASVQPVRGADLKLLPEGELVTEFRTVYSKLPMPMGSRVVTASDGRVWRVRIGNDWQTSGTYSRAVVKLNDKDEA